MGAGQHMLRVKIVQNSVLLHIIIQRSDKVYMYSFIV